MKSNVYRATLALMLSLGLSAYAQAESAVTVDVSAEPETALASQQPSPVSPAQVVPVFALGMPVAPEQLASQRGGFDVVQNDLQLNGAVANNSAVNVASGHNVITEGSFAHASGFPMVVQNTGSNVLIQNATIINLQLQ